LQKSYKTPGTGGRSSNEGNPVPNNRENHGNQCPKGHAEVLQDHNQIKEPISSRLEAEIAKAEAKAAKSQEFVCKLLEKNRALSSKQPN